MIFKISLLFVATIIAFWLSAICGGGASLVLIPILNLLLPTSVVPFSLTIGTFTSSASRLTVFWKKINWKIFIWFVPFSIPSVWVGAYLIKFTNPHYLQLIVAVLLVANLPQLFVSKGKMKEEQKPYAPYVLAIVGFLAGFVSGITGSIGLLFNRFYLKYGLTKEEIVATRAANEIFLHMMKLVIYILLGLYSELALYLGLTIAAASIVSSVSVKYILPFISEFLFRKIGYGVMVLSGIVLLVGTSTDIIQADKLNLSSNKKGKKYETEVSWRDTQFVLEYSFNGSFEVERPIGYEELPIHLKREYDLLIEKYDYIKLEKVFKFREPPSYEFYAFKDGDLTKMEFDGK